MNLPTTPCCRIHSAQGTGSKLTGWAVTLPRESKQVLTGKSMLPSLAKHTGEHTRGSTCHKCAEWIDVMLHRNYSRDKQSYNFRGKSTLVWSALNAVCMYNLSEYDLKKVSLANKQWAHVKGLFKSLVTEPIGGQAGKRALWELSVYKQGSKDAERDC